MGDILDLLSPSQDASHKWRFRLGSPTKDIWILVVTFGEGKIQVMYIEMDWWTKVHNSHMTSPIIFDDVKNAANDGEWSHPIPKIACQTLCQKWVQLHTLLDSSPFSLNGLAIEKHPEKHGHLWEHAQFRWICHQEFAILCGKKTSFSCPLEGKLKGFGFHQGSPWFWKRKDYLSKLW